MLTCFVAKAEQTVPILLLTKTALSEWQAQQDAFTQNYFITSKFKNEPGFFCLLPDKEGKLAKVICCIGDSKNFWSVGNLALSLPEGQYHFEGDCDAEAFTIAWGLGAYQFSRYKTISKTPAALYLPKELAQSVNDYVESIYLVRDLINTPTDDLGPAELAEAAKQLAKDCGAECDIIVGEELLKSNYASIYTVGRASDDAPRLIDLTWGNPSHPKITLVGKGVCFDSGGLDIKPASAMLLMKKDMAGAAHVLGLARLIIKANLPVRLRVLIPAVENVIAGNAYRPGDVIKSRKGLTVEIGNTDAEGRVVLSDALTEATSESLDLLIDISTLTGAARIAVGTEISALFSNDDEVADAVIAEGAEQLDYMWRLPLFDNYREMLNSQIADINNASTEAYGGAITAALFLKEFVPENIPWLHFDMMAWNLRNKPGRPQGGEAMAIRGLFAYLKKRYQPRN